MRSVIYGMLAAGALLIGSSLPAHAWGVPHGHPGVGMHREVQGHHSFHEQRMFQGHHEFREHRGFRHGREHHHFRTHIFIASPLFLEPDFVEPPVIVPQPPSVYIQDGSPQTYWYYCPDSQSYYPYVQECPSGWLTVVPPAQ